MPIDPHHLQPYPPQPLSDLLNLCQDPILVVEPATGRLQRTNPAAQHWYGISCASGENHTLQSVFPDLATPESQDVLSRLATGELEAADLPVFFTSTDGTVTCWNAALRWIEADGKTAIGIVLQHADTDRQSCSPSLEAIARRAPLTGVLACRRSRAGLEYRRLGHQRLLHVGDGEGLRLRCRSRRGAPAAIAR